MFKGLAYGLSLGSYRGGPTFPALFLGAAAGIMCSHLPGFPLPAAVPVGMGTAIVAVLRLPLSAVVLATLLTSHAGPKVEPLIIVGVVVAYVVTLVMARPPASRRHPHPSLPLCLRRTRLSDPNSGLDRPDFGQAAALPVARCVRRGVGEREAEPGEGEAVEHRSAACLAIAPTKKKDQPDRQSDRSRAHSPLSGSAGSPRARIIHYATVHRGQLLASDLLFGLGLAVLMVFAAGLYRIIRRAEATPAGSRWPRWRAWLPAGTGGLAIDPRSSRTRAAVASGTGTARRQV